MKEKCNMSCGYDSTYGFVPEADCPVHDKPTEPVKEDWETKWNEEFEGSCFGVNQATSENNIKDIKAFIRQTKEDILLQIEKEVSEKFKDEHPTEDGVPVETYGYEQTFNQGLQVALGVIKKFKE